MKAISKEQIDALQRYSADFNFDKDEYDLRADSHGDAVKLSDLRALYDNAPSLGGEPFCWAVNCKKEYYDVYNPDERHVIVSDAISLRDYLEDSDAWIVTPLYTTPQPDRVAELEGKLNQAYCEINNQSIKLRECEVDAKRWNTVSFAIEQAIKNGACNYEIEDAYDQAMKGE